MEMIRRLSRGSGPNRNFSANSFTDDSVNAEEKMDIDNVKPRSHSNSFAGPYSYEASSILQDDNGHICQERRLSSPKKILNSLRLSKRSMSECSREDIDISGEQNSASSSFLSGFMARTGMRRFSSSDPNPVMDEYSKKHLDDTELNQDIIKVLFRD